MTTDKKDLLIGMGTLAIAGACLLTGNCQLGAMAAGGSALYFGKGTLDEITAAKKQKTDLLQK